MKNEKGFTSFELIVTVIIIAGIGGWIANIIKLSGCNFDPITGILVIRAIGIFVPPLGAVMGFI